MSSGNIEGFSNGAPDTKIAESTIDNMNVTFFGRRN